MLIASEAAKAASEARVEFVCMIEFCLRDGLTRNPPPGDEDGEASAQIVLDLAARPGDEQAIALLAEWIRETDPTLKPRRSLDTEP